MKTNVKIDLTDDERNRLAVLFDGKQSKRLATRADIVSFVNACLDAALDADPNRHDRPSSPAQAGEWVIHDINEGGWSILDQ